MAECPAMEAPFWTAFDRCRWLTPPASARQADRVTLALWTMFVQTVDHLRALDARLDAGHDVDLEHEAAYGAAFAVASRLGEHAPFTIDGMRVRATAVAFMMMGEPADALAAAVGNEPLREWIG